MKKCECKECQCEMIDIFETKEFKALSWRKRIWIRLKVAFFETISMH